MYEGVYTTNQQVMESKIHVIGKATFTNNGQGTKGSWSHSGSVRVPHRCD